MAVVLILFCRQVTYRFLFLMCKEALEPSLRFLNPSDLRVGSATVGSRTVLLPLCFLDLERLLCKGCDDAYHIVLSLT
jgi:hypothetical protein